MRDDQADNHQTDELLRHIVINFVIASRDAIGVTLTWLVYELSMHSDASHRLYLELRDYESRRQFECECSVEQYWDVELQDEDYVRMMDTRIREFAALITSESLDELPFLHACLQETLRLHPAVPLVRLMSHIFLHCWFWNVIVIFIFVDLESWWEYHNMVRHRPT